MVSLTPSASTATPEMPMKAANRITINEVRPVRLTSQPTTVLPHKDPRKAAAPRTAAGMGGMAPPSTNSAVVLVLMASTSRLAVAVAVCTSTPRFTIMGFNTIAPPMPTTALTAPTSTQSTVLTSGVRVTTPAVTSTKKPAAVMTQYAQEQLWMWTMDSPPPPRRTITRIMQSQMPTNFAQPQVLAASSTGSLGTLGTLPLVLPPLRRVRFDCLSSS
mmetsp:Transcript_45921/g.109093  ORF Transcript_45921/g.109093 Transcript_45921/m.109093 type:complete len:217 (-) Transcript_45921:596-1246(-)